MPEADSVMIAAGVALGATGEMNFADTFLYGRQLNPGVFLFMRLAYPSLWSNPASVIGILNWVSVICGALTVLPLYHLLRISLPVRAAIACACVWMFTPLVWESQTSFHPVVPATLLLLLALACGRRAYRSRRGLPYLFASSVLAAAAVVTRADVAIIWPSVAIFALAARDRRRAFGILLATTAAAIVAYWLVLRFTAGDLHSGGRSVVHFWDRWRALYGMSYSLARIPRALAWAGMGIGIATLGACLWGLVSFARSSRDPQAARDRTAGVSLLGGLVWVLPSLIFWAPYTNPLLRHYYVPSLGLVWLAGWLVWRHTSGRRLIAVAIMVIGLNLLVPEALYRVYNRTHTAKTPHGAFFYLHEVASREVERLVNLRESALGCARSADGRARSLVLCRWDGFANLTYGVASRGGTVSRGEDQPLFPEVVISAFTSERADVQMIRYLYMEDATLRTRVSDAMLTAWNEGYCIFIPESIRPFETLRGLEGVYYYR